MTFRKKLEDLWNVDLSVWWLPNGEGCPPVIRQIRNFITSTPNDTTGEDLRDFKGIFASLSLSDASSPESAQNSPEVHERGPPIERAATEHVPSTTYAKSKDNRYEWESPNALDRAVACGESPEFEWS